MGYHPLVCRRFKIIFFWNPHCGEATLKRIVHELTTERYEKDVLSTLSGDPRMYWVETSELETTYKKFKKILVVRDPWSRLVHYVKDALVRKKTDFFIEKRHRMIDVRNTTTFELIKLLSILNPTYLTESLEFQKSGLEDISMDAVISFDSLERDLASFLKDLSIPFESTTSYRNLKEDLETEEGEILLMARGYVGKVRPSSFHQGGLPPTNCFFDKETWGLLADVYREDLKAFECLAKPNPF